MRFFFLLLLVVSITSRSSAFPSIFSARGNSNELELTRSYYHSTYPSTYYHPTYPPPTTTKATTTKATTTKATTTSTTTTHPTTTEITTTTEKTTTRATTHPTATKSTTTRAITTTATTTKPTTTQSTSECPKKCVYLRDAVKECKGLLDRCYIQSCSPDSYRQLGQYFDHNEHVNGLELSNIDFDINRSGEYEDEEEENSYLYGYASCEDLPSVTYSTPEPEPEDKLDCVALSKGSVKCKCPTSDHTFTMVDDISSGGLLKDEAGCFKWCYGRRFSVNDNCYSGFGESLLYGLELRMAKTCCERVCHGVLSGSDGSYTCEAKHSYH